MADVVVNQSHSLSQDEAKNRLEAFEQLLAKYMVKPVWSGYSASLKGMGVSGSIEVTPDQVQIKIKLGFAAKAVGVDPTRLKGSIEKRLGPALSDN